MTSNVRGPMQKRYLYLKTLLCTYQKMRVNHEAEEWDKVLYVSAVPKVYNSSSSREGRRIVYRVIVRQNEGLNGVNKNGSKKVL